jgi:hypothetical protein
MICRKQFICLLWFSIYALLASAQDFSGLQYRQLKRSDDLSSTVESLLGRIGGKLDGNIDSVVVQQDYAKELRVLIYYTGYTNGYFTVSTMALDKQRDPWITPVRFQANTSPAEAVLLLNDQLPRDGTAESPYLRIDISKTSGGAGQVRIFSLRKNWKADASGIIYAKLQPIGAAASLSPTQPIDIIPARKIHFETKAALYDENLRIRRPVTSGRNAFISLNRPQPYADISGNWLNRDNTNSPLSRLYITNNNYVVLYRGTGSSQSEITKGPLKALNATQYRGEFLVDSKMDVKPSPMELDLTLNGNDLSVTTSSLVKTFASTVRRTNSYTFYRQASVFENKVGVFNLDQVGQMHWITDPAPASTVPLGPDKNFQINLWDGIAVDNQVDFSRPQDISNINVNVFADKNINSGVYYILPADYHLLWDPATNKGNGYALSISYGKQGDPGVTTGAEAPVRISAILTSGISIADRNFVKALLKARIANFKDLKYLPLRENIQTTFQNTLSSQFNVPADKISVNSSTDLNNNVTVAWLTNSDTKEFIQTVLTSGEGITASVILKPENQEILDQQIPANIALADNRSLGKMSLEPNRWRTTEWQNRTSYPLTIKYLHVLKKSNQDNKPIIYSWAVNHMEVPPGGLVSFDNNSVPKWLDADPSVVMWLNYSVKECTTCNDSVINAVTDGVVNSLSQQLQFVIAPAVYDTLKASYFTIVVRSRQGDPKGETIKELEPIKLTRDAAKEFYAGPIYIPKGSSPDFEYNIRMASEDGEFYLSDKWIRSTEKTVYLGKKEMKEIFRGIIPGIN